MTFKVSRAMRLFEEYVGQRSALGHPVKEDKAAWSSSPPWVRDVWIAVADVHASRDEVADLRPNLERTQVERDNLQHQLNKTKNALTEEHRLRNEALERVEMSERALATMTDRAADPIPMHLWCPACGAQHLDVGEFATRPHKTHTCQTCGFCWMPCLHPTVGVQFLPGTKNEVKP